jgi:hypothetical protein
MKEFPLARPARVLALLAVVLAATACTGGKHQSAQQATTTTAPAAALRVTLRTSATGTDRAADAKRAAERAAPGLEQFLDSYLTAAFIKPAGGRSGWGDLLALFDQPVRAAASRQLDALSLGTAAGKVTSVQPGKADASALLLLGGGRPVAATVQLEFDGTAVTGQGSGPVHLRSTFQLLSTGNGWRIAAFSSRTGSAG